MESPAVILEAEMTVDIISVRKRKTIQVRNPDDFYEAVKHYAKREQECFIVATLDCSHSIIGVHLSTMGLVNRTIVHTREVFRHAIEDNAVAIIICHNHPSGELIPSPEDFEITEKLAESGRILGIPVLDHVIINKKDFYSFKISGNM
jgi:DNA repair protein RadC